MGSPFPGMDPYLEGDMWQEFHDRLAGEISAQLLPKLAPKYVALLARRYVYTRPTIGISDRPLERAVYPDVSVTKLREAHSAYAAIAEPDVEFDAYLAEDVPITSIEVRDVATRTLVTVIELLSPANKFEPGHEEYQRKRANLLLTRTHILEIDLLRRGERVDLGAALPPAPYYAILNRFNRRVNEVFLLQLRSRLKVLPVPLLPPDRDVPLDLQAAVDACFKLVGYERLLPYNEAPPLPELAPEDLAWVEGQLRAAGTREG